MCLLPASSAPTSSVLPGLRGDTTESHLQAQDLFGRPENGLIRCFGDVSVDEYGDPFSSLTTGELREVVEAAAPMSLRKVRCSTMWKFESGIRQFSFSCL